MRRPRRIGNWIGALFVVLLGGCSETSRPGPSPVSAPAAGSPPRAAGIAATDEPKVFQQGLGRDGVTLVDVRTPEEFADGHLEGARNIDWSAPGFETEISKVDKSRPVYIYCGVGARSAKAMAVMQRLGFVEVHNLAGGIMDWRGQGLPLGK